MSLDKRSQDLLQNSQGPVGIFDSGLGGLSVLRHVQQQLPHEDLLYFADTAFAPYGGKSEEVIVARSIAIAEHLLQRGAKALVVACNTATAAAIKGLREIYPELPVVGVETGLKPAVAWTKSGIVGVLATAVTLSSDKFDQLRTRISSEYKVQFLSRACVGLVDQIEKGELDTPATIALIEGYMQPLIEQGADTLVLGCTHYPFVRTQIEQIARAGSNRDITIIDTGDAVARQLRRLLEQHKLLRETNHVGDLQASTTASTQVLSAAFKKLLDVQLSATQIDLQHQTAPVA
jgi:glutamate racemase